MIDFGLSKHFRYGEVQHEAVGTPYTVAPYVYAVFASLLFDAAHSEESRTYLLLLMLC